MKILVSGSRGLIGSALVTQLTSAGPFVVRLVRDVPDRDRGDIFWDPVSARIERSGGSCRVQSIPGAGTLVTLAVLP